MKPLTAVAAATRRRDAAQTAWAAALVAAAKEHTLEEIAQVAGISRQRASQIVGPVGRPPGRRAGREEVAGRGNAPRSPGA